MANNRRTINKGSNQAISANLEKVANRLENINLLSNVRFNRIYKLSYNILKLISSKIIFRVIPCRLKFYMKKEMPEVQTPFRKGQRTESLFLMHSG